MKKFNKIICLILCACMLVACGQHNAGNLPTDTEATTETNDSTRKDPPEADNTSGSILDPTRLDDYVADFASVTDADPGLEITVISPESYSADDVLAGITLSNFTSPILIDPDETDLIEPDYLEATGERGVFTVTCVDGFNPGNTYQLFLKDELLHFGSEAPEVRYFNITTAAESKDNLRLESTVKYLDADSLNDKDAQGALKLDSLYRLDPESGEFAPNNGAGSFVYAEGAYNIGDIVAVYEGIQPDLRTFDDAEDEVAYVQIRGIIPSGNGQATYLYEGAHQDDVLFTPDVFPVQQDIKLTSGQTDSLTLDASMLQFSSDQPLAEIGLDENTSVDVGDFLAFYTGSMEDGEVTAYAEITEVTHNEENDRETVTVNYRSVTLEEMMRSADSYRQASLTEEQIRAAYDEEAIKEGVIEDLTNNGYLMESTYALAELALETDEAQELFGDTPIEELTFYYGENEEYSMSGAEYQAIMSGKPSNAVDIKGDASVHISPNIIHFAGKTGYGTGVRVEVNAKYTVTVKSPSVRAGLRVIPTLFFETEVVFGITGDASAIWKWKWIFPYIYDYNISGSAAAGIYVGVGFTASAALFDTTKVADEGEEVAGIPWPDGVDQTPGNERVMEIANYVKTLGKEHAEIFPPQTTGGGTLVQKYASFAYGANNGWVDLIEKNIFDLNFSIFPLHIFAMRVKADFIVAAQFNAAIGLGVNYERAYRETFSFLLFRQESTGNANEETDISTFRADFYVFGALGIRAGIRLGIGVGLFDARLDSVGLELEGGLYAKFWGFFYAGVEIKDVGKASATTDAYYEGGMLLEAGAYFKVTFIAQLGDGSIAYKKILEEYEKPFFGVGTDNVVTDFKYKEGENYFAAEFTRDATKAMIPTAAFMMTSMSIKDGSVNDTDRSKIDARDQYEITFDDPDFSYVYENGKHYIVRNNPNGGEGTLKMTLRWKGLSFEQLSKELKRTIEVTWVAQMRSMKFLNKDGSIFFILAKPAGTKLEPKDLPASDPVSYGYIFQGWLKEDGSRLAKMPDVMPEEDTVFTSDWVGAPTTVNVQYYVPNGRNQYNLYNFELQATDVVDGYVTGDKIDNIINDLKIRHLLRTEADFEGEGPTYPEHYVINMTPSVVSTDFVSYEGTTVFEIWLNYVEYTVTFDNGDGTQSQKICTIEKEIEFPSVSRPGYIFKGWQDPYGNTVNVKEPHICTGDIVYTAIWEKLPPQITVTAQVKIKSWGATYYWQTIRTQTFILDTEEITVQELLDMLNVGDEYVFSSSGTGRDPEDVIQIADDGSTTVTLRFTQKSN